MHVHTNDVVISQSNSNANIKSPSHNLTRPSLDAFRPFGLISRACPVMTKNQKALVFAPAEYCASIWYQSTHTKTLDVPLNEAMRIVLGCIRPNPLNFLQPLSGTQPPSCRRKNSVNAYTAKQVTLTIFYTTSCTAKSLPISLNHESLFANFWNHYKAMTHSKNQYHINCNHTSKTGQTNP